MTETEDKIIAQLLAKQDELEKELIESKGKSKDWFSAPMIMAYLSIIGILGTNLENITSRVTYREHVQQENQVDETTQGVLADALLKEIASVSEQCDKNFEAIRSTLPAWQQRKLDRSLNGISITDPVAEGVGDPDASLTPSLTPDPAESVETVVKQELADPKTIFQELKQEVRKGDVTQLRAQEVMKDYKKKL